MPSIDRLETLVDEPNQDAATRCLEEFETAAPDQRKRAVQSLRSLGDADPALFDGLVKALVPFLEDDERAVRLSTAKLLVTIADAEPTAVRPVVDAVSDRFADEDEFYYVRARCAEALGYVALEHPGDVNSPETLANLRIGLEFDEPEPKEKLAKAIEYVALGDPDRLRHQVERLAEHFDDDGDLVRYHLCTALVAVGCTHPERLADVTEQLAARLDDPEPYVRGRAAEALGLVAGSGADVEVPADDLAPLAEVDESFVAERARFARSRTGGVGGETPSTTVGTLDAVKASSDSAVEDMTTPDADGECPQCGLELPGEGPPMCPRCGVPR